MEIGSARDSHEPVLVEEILFWLHCKPGGVYVDGTLGYAGLAARLLDRTAPDGILVGIDRDATALAESQVRLREVAHRVHFRHGNFCDLKALVVESGVTRVDGVIFDLGVSSPQLDRAERGFSFREDGPLDMRMNPLQGNSAADIVNEWNETELADIIYIYGEDRLSRRIARSIVQNRPFSTTGQLAKVIEKSLGRRGDRIHPATRTFQALRIVVNSELEQIEAVLPQCLRLLRSGGRLAVISFHSLEDRIVKHWMQAEASDFLADPMNVYGGTARQPTLKIITRKPIEAGAEEIEKNPRSRSAKLRIAEKAGSR